MTCEHAGAKAISHYDRTTWSQDCRAVWCPDCGAVGGDVINTDGPVQDAVVRQWVLPRRLTERFTAEVITMKPDVDAMMAMAEQQKRWNKSVYISADDMLDLLDAVSVEAVYAIHEPFAAARAVMHAFTGPGITHLDDVRRNALRRLGEACGLPFDAVPAERPRGGMGELAWSRRS